MTDERDNTQIFLDEVQELHRSYDALAGRVAKLEERGKGNASDGMTDVMLWLAIAYVVSMLLPPLVQMWTGKGVEQ
jgi:hypothetical protein